MPDMITDQVTFAFFSCVLLLFLWIAFDTRRALTALILGQRAARSLSEPKLRFFRISTAMGSVLVAILLIRHLIR